MTGVWFRRAESPCFGRFDDSLITNSLRFCLYKLMLMIKDFEARIYNCTMLCDEASLWMRSELRHGLSPWKELKIVKMSHPQKEPDLRVALQFASVFIISCQSSISARFGCDGPHP